MRFYGLGFRVCLLAFAVVSCGGTALHVGMSENVNATASGSPATANSPNQSKSDQAVYSLDLQNPEVMQKIRRDDGDAAKARFVQIEVIEVVNPQKRRAQFEVHYEPTDGKKILLGGFSLYPPDNPGKFIVPTHGKVKPEGTLILSLTKLDHIAPGDVLKVTVRPMKFVE